MIDAIAIMIGIALLVGIIAVATLIALERDGWPDYGESDWNDEDDDY